MSFIEKETPCGTVKGIDGERCVEYRGIRYATAKRYERPEIVTHWDGTYDATEFGACCFQHRAFEDDATVNPFYHKEFRKGIKFKYSEDCQFLNIWAPKDARDCPVLIFIHGGTFTGGSADEGHIKGTRFAEKGVIVVAMNYRIGPYGFCAHEDLKDENGYLANFGLYDQTAAIKWVIRNIASLGGDPKRITLMGQSAGAISVDIHLNDPELKGKLAGAVMISGAGQTFLVLEIWAMIMDIIDYHELLSGRREEGTAYSFYSFARKLGQTAAGAGVPAILELIKYNGDLAEQPPEVAKKLYDIPPWCPPSF